MKFERGFDRHQVPQWAPFYMNYSLAKRHFKIACAASHQRHANVADYSSLLAILKDDRERVESFYLDRYASICDERSTAYGRYSIKTDSIGVINFVDVDPAGVDPRELRDLRISCKEILRELKALQSFGELNSAGFRMMFYKFERHRIGSGQDLQDIVGCEQSHFFHQDKLLLEYETSVDAFGKLSQALTESQVSSKDYSSMFLQISCFGFSLAEDIRKTFQFAVNRDLGPELERLLDEYIALTYGDDQVDSLLFVLLQYSMLHGSKECIEALLLRIQSSGSWVTDRVTNLQRLRSSLALLCRLATPNGQRVDARGANDYAENDTNCQDLAIFVLSRLQPAGLGVLMQEDTLGRLLLHDAATRGLEKLCQTYLNHLHDMNQSQETCATEAILYRDLDGMTPLCLAVIAGSAAVTKALLDFYTGGKARSSAATPYENSLQRVLDDLLPVAIKSDFAEVVELLLMQHANPSHPGTREETALYVAARYGQANYIEDILKYASPDQIKIDQPEISRGWTPLMVACVEGHLSIVKHLLRLGANQGQCDLLGWTAKEHAAFRGHLDIVNLLAHHSTQAVPDQRLPPALKPATTQLSRNRNTETQIWITLGSPNTRDPAKAVDMRASKANDSPLIHAFSVEVVATDTSASTDTGASARLPLLSDMIYHPWHFTTNDLSKVNARFNIYEDSYDDKVPRTLIGSGVSILQNLKHGLAANREGLARYCSIPLLERDSFELMGTVTFGVVIITPFTSKEPVPQMATLGFWKEDGPTQVVGHRGSGANAASANNLQLGENTIQSYLSAASAGASSVEFDVQLTKDLVPVIFHDFLVMEAGGDTPLYTLKLNQFLHLSESQTPRSDITGLAETRYLTKNQADLGSSSRPRSYSLKVYDDSRSVDLAERMKHTEDSIAGAHKGNLRGECIQGVFPTLEDLFTKLPDTIGFNVEMKYPMLWEAEDRNMDTYAPELNVYVDIVLEKIYRLGGKRSITFSSFSPEVCIALSVKQQDYPVLFLSKAGAIPVGDVRCSSLQQSIQFAKRYGLAGIVMFSDPLIACPRLVQYAKSAGLVCCSYGPRNNELECAKVCA